jgi:hypothetical protein
MYPHLATNPGIDRRKLVSYGASVIYGMKPKAPIFCRHRHHTSGAAENVFFVNLQAPCILYIGHAYRYSPEYTFYIFSQQIYYLIIFLYFHHLCLFLHKMSCIS